MALPVAATPVLEAEEARMFFAKVDSNLKKPSRLIATPKLQKVNILIKNYANKRRQK